MRARPSRSAYVLGCRCAECERANTEYMTALRENKNSQSLMLSGAYGSIIPFAEGVQVSEPAPLRGRPPAHSTEDRERVIAKIDTQIAALIEQRNRNAKAAQWHAEQARKAQRSIVSLLEQKDDVLHEQAG